MTENLEFWRTKLNQEIYLMSCTYQKEEQAGSSWSELGHTRVNWNEQESPETNKLEPPATKWTKPKT